MSLGADSVLAPAHSFLKAARGHRALGLSIPRMWSVEVLVLGGKVLAVSLGDLLGPHPDAWAGGCEPSFGSQRKRLL